MATNAPPLDVDPVATSGSGGTGHYVAAVWLRPAACRILVCFVATLLFGVGHIQTDERWRCLRQRAARAAWLGGSPEEHRSRLVRVGDKRAPHISFTGGRGRMAVDLFADPLLDLMSARDRLQGLSWLPLHWAGCSAGARTGVIAAAAAQCRASLLRRLRRRRCLRRHSRTEGPASACQVC